MKKRIFRIITALILLTSVLLCSCSNKEPLKEPAATASPQNSDTTYKIAFVEYNNAYQENSMREAFLSRMRLLGYDEIKMKFDVKNAQCDDGLLKKYVAELKNSDYNLIVAVSDRACVEISKAEIKIPCVFMGATDPVGNGLTTSIEKPDKNMTGCVMNVSEEKITSLIRIFTPEVKTVGIIVCKDNAFSQKNAEAFKEKAKFESITSEIYTIDDTKKTEEKISQILASVDALYIPEESRLDADMAKIVELAAAEKKFVFSSDTSAVNNGALASFCSSPKKIGDIAAVMADEIIRGKSVTDIPIDTSVAGNFFLSSKTYSRLGIGIPDLENLEVL